MKKIQWVTCKKYFIALSSICLITFATICFVTIGSKAEDSGGYAITHGYAINNLVPPENGEKGTADNPLVLLELVPDMKFASIGYLIKGCEPVDVDKMLQDLKNGDNNVWNYLPNVCRNGIANLNQSDYKNIRYEHYNSFLKNVVQIPDSEIADYHVVVKTITPSELNDNSQWAERADLVYITNKSYSPPLSNVNMSKYSKIPYKPASGIKDRGDFANFSNSNDLKWKTVMKLFNKIVLDEDASGAVIDQNVFVQIQNFGVEENIVKKSISSKQIGLDGKATSNTITVTEGCNNNVFKLCLMLDTMNPQAFYNLFLYDYPDESRKASVTEETVEGRNTGVFTIQQGDARSYWGMNTFMPPKLDGSASTYDDWRIGECFINYETKTQFGYSNATVNSSVFKFPGNMNMLDDLANESKIDPSQLGGNAPKELTKELFDYIYEETGKTPSTTSPAMAVRFIMGLEKSGKTKPSINILDLEPCTVSYTLPYSKSYLKELDLRTRIIPKYAGKINIVHQSTAEFNSRLEDINSTYDMIYMGLYDGRLNISSGNTVYNNTELKGKIYLHVGDKIISRNSNPYTVQWPTDMNNVTRGPGNDITNLKKAALEGYLKAGLPIVANEDLYKVNPQYIDQYSNISKFIKDNNTTSGYVLLNQGNASTGGVLLNHFKKSGLILHMKEGDYPKTYVGNSTDGKISDSAYVLSNYISYHFSLEDSEYTSGVTYTARLYIDINHDGSYTSDEEIFKKTSLKADKTSYSMEGTLDKKYEGVIPWRLVVTKDSNSVIRDSQQGVFAIKRDNTKKRVIKVLQITDDLDTNMNLQKNIEEKGIFDQYTSNLNDYTFEFTTEDIATFEMRYNATNKFVDTTEEMKMTSDQLSGYNMLILGFANSNGDFYSNISNQYGALDNIKFFIDSGKSVVFTHDVTSFFNLEQDDLSANNSSNRGYNFNRYFRGYLGMDRFGVRTGTDKAKDKATNISGGEYKEIHGYTYQAISQLADWSVNQKALFSELPKTNSVTLTTKADKLNEGQITEYPYKIDEIPTIESTHSQYYQLDLERENVKVWYTLAPNTSDNGQFSCSAYDGSNNYYIYSKDNVTYSGVGHKDITNNSTEVKLFINTLILAFGNGVDTPSVEVVNPGVYSTAPNDYSMYISVDYAETTFNEARYEDISFIARSNSSASAIVYVKAMTADNERMDIYYEGGNKVVLDSSGYAKLIDGVVYHLKWSQSYLKNQDKKNIIFQCYYIDEKDNTRFGLTKAHLLRRNLFDLD